MIWEGGKVDSITLKGKLIIVGEIRAVTGLHIGGAAAGLDIGGIDNPIIRHPITR
jgi:CRISPR-associated protein Csm3